MSVIPKRLPRYYRVKNPPKIQNFRHYLNCLELIRSYRFLNTAQIIALTGISKGNVSTKLQKLYHNGYVDRYQIPTMEYFRGSAKMIYTLDRKGAELLEERDPDRFSGIYYPKRKRSVYFVEHALMISNFRACLTLALEKRRAKLDDWRQGRELHKQLEKYQAKNLGLVADAYFSIIHNGKRLHYFFEADRATMTLTRFYEKVKRYRKFFRQHRKRLPSRFRVLTLTPTAKRADNLRIVTINGDSEKAGSKRFWFTSERQFSLESLNNLLGPIIKIGFLGLEEKCFSILD